MSPQSNTVAQLWKGLAAKGTLYPPLHYVLVSFVTVAGREYGSRTRDLDGENLV